MWSEKIVTNVSEEYAASILGAEAVFSKLHTSVLYSNSVFQCNILQAKHVSVKNITVHTV